MPNPSHLTAAMARALKTLTRSLRTFSRNRRSFAAASALLAFPVSAASLLAHSLPASSPLLRTISSSLAALFEAAGFPPSPLFSLLNSKLSQSLFTYLATLPFALTFLLLAKASIFRIARGTSSPRLYPSLVRTHLFNSLLTLSANAAVLSLLLLAFNALSLLHLSTGSAILAVSASGVILYSFVLASAAVVCNLATVIAAVDRRSAGWLSVLKALVLVRGRTATAITLTLPASLGAVAMEALFRLRVTRPYHVSGGACHPWVIVQAFLIVYTHSLLLVLDTIISCVFLESCGSPSCVRWSRSSKYDDAYGQDIDYPFDAMQ